MSQRLISRSPDLQQLWDEGFDVEVRGSYLLVKNVPYVNADKKVRRGILVSAITLAGDVTAPPNSHQVWFAGDYPCREDGSPIETIRNVSERKALDRGLVVDHYFSNKSSSGGDQNHYDKMTRYIGLISAPAQAIDPNATAKVNLFQLSDDEDSPFVYLDTASSDAGTTAVSRKLELANVAIVGLGGTGSYVLDLVAKTPVKLIHLFDGDPFLQHNAFRSPGAASIEELQARPSKVEYLTTLYSRMHRGIVPHDYYLEGDKVEELRQMEFIFLCLDRGYAKRDIVSKLLEWHTPFIDVAMGVDLTDEVLAGVLGVTSGTTEKHDHIMQRVTFSNADPNADYSRSIQIADLNALNAALAVVKWKKLRGFYRDLAHEHYSTYTVDTNVLSNEETV